MGIGISFGSKGGKTSTKTTVDKNETTNQQQTGTTTSQQATTASQSGTSSTASQGTSTQSQTGQTQQQTSGQQQSAQQSQLFSSDIISGLEAAIKGSLAPLSSGGVSTGALNFDPTSFVSKGLEGARATQATNLEATLGSQAHAIGGTEGSNSMATLLANRTRGDAAANLAGIEAGLTGQAQEIVRNNILAQQQVRGSEQGFMTQLLGALKGGAATTTGTAGTTESTTGSSAQQGQSSTTESQQQQTAQQSQQMTSLIQMMQQLMSGTTNTTGTESSVGKTKESGGGFGLSL